MIIQKNIFIFEPSLTVKTTEVEYYTNQFGVTFKVGDKGEILKNFSKNNNPQQVSIVSFTPSGRYMRCKNERGVVYLFSTDNCNLKGSHMGNTYVSFRGFEDVNK